MIRLDGVELRRGGARVLGDASLAIRRRWKVGVVGANGAGKSSLLALLLGELEPDRGEVELPAGIATATVAQEAPGGDVPLIDYVVCGDPRIAAIRARLADAGARGDAAAEAAAHADLEAVHGYAAEAAASRVLRGLGFAPDDGPRRLDTLSGGWRMRAALARTLAAPSDLLLLDEPTNHLDLDAVVWLEGWLRRYAGTLLLISHDREFLDPVVDHVALVAGGRVSLYTGSYSAFERLRAVELEHSRRAADRQRRERARVRAFVDRFRYKASKARQAQSRLKALERMEAVAPVPVERRFAFEFLEPERSPRPVVKLEAASFGYGGHTVLHEVSMALAPGDRVALLGANGAGKSTLMRGMAGRLAPTAGAVERSPYTKVGYFAQHRLDQLDPHRTPLELARAAAPGMREQEMRDFLGGFGFGADPATSRIAPLSGGEKTRLALALLILERPNLLLLDEPTNHLDLDMRQSLALALQSYSGALVLVSHDRHLLRLVSDSLWLVAGGRAAPFGGDLDDYRCWLSERPAAARGRDMMAGPRPSGTAAGGGPGKVSGSSPSDTVAAGGRDAAAGSCPSSGTMTADGSGKGPGSSPSGTVAAGGRDEAEGLHPSDTVAPGGWDKAARAAGERLPPAGTDPFDGPPPPGEPRSGGVTPADATAAPDRRERRRLAAEERRRIAPLRREIDLLERRLAALGDERAFIESALADAAVYDDAQRPRLRTLLVRRGRLDAEIAEVESLWLERSEQLDAMRGLAVGASRGAE